MKYKNIKWKTKTCKVGKECWCRMIVTKSGKKVQSAGTIDKDMAKYIVRMHNYFLELNS